MATIAGGKLVHMYRWDAEEALKIIEREKITNLSGVPVMSRELLAHPKFEEYDTSSLQALGGGGAALPRAVLPAGAEARARDEGDRRRARAAS